MKKQLLLIYFGIVMLLNISLILGWTATLDNGLRDYFPFDQTTGTSVYNYANVSRNASSVNAPQFIPGKVNNAIELNSSLTQYLVINTTRETGNWSISWWENFHMPNANAMLLGDTPGNLYINAKISSVAIHIGTSPTITHTNAANSWQHLVIRYDADADNVSLWQNGSLLGVTTLGGANDLNTQIYIGTWGGFTLLWNGSIDELGVWNRTLSANEIIELSNGANPSSGGVSGVPTLNSPFNNAHVITGNNTFNCSVSNLNGFNVTNMSFYHNSTGTWARNLTLNTAANVTSVNGTLFGLNITSSLAFDWTCKACFGDGSCNYAIENRTINYENFIENSITYNPTTLSGSLETFVLNLTYDSSAFTGISVLLNYNNTNYSTMVTGIGNNRIFTGTITVPSITVPINKTFNFIVSLTDITGSTFTSTSHNQTIYNVALDNCTNYNVTLMNFTMLDEENLALMNGTIEVTANIYSYKNLANLIGVFNATMNFTTGYKTGICFSNTTTISNYTLAYTIRHYGNSSYYKIFRQMQKMDVTSATPTQVLTLYNLLIASGYPFNTLVVGNLYSAGGNSNLLVSAQKQYVGLDVFNLVESSITDTDGKTVLHLIPSNDIYNFIVSLNGIVLGTFNNYQVKCDNLATADCKITLNLANASGTLPDFFNYANISYYYDMNKVTNILTLTYNSINGIAHNVRMKTIEYDNFGNTTICDTNGYGISGAFTCVIPIAYQNTTFYSQLYVDGKYVGTQFFTLGMDITSTDLYGVDIIIEILMFTSLVMLMMASPILIVIGAMLGFLFAIILLFITGGSFGSLISSIIFFILAGMIIIWQISKRI